ncbi:MAG: hypothetical protein U9Q83_07335, partial [Bacteroidota bacterium]|nr:hypothetical protein [Bacteroidota bacterium]
MKKLLVILLTVLVAFSACKNNGDSDNDNQNDSTAVNDGSLKMLTFDKSVMDKLDNVKGDLVFGYKWEDKMGINVLVFTTQEKFSQMRYGGPQDGHYTKFMKAYHFAGTEHHYSLIRMIQDGDDACQCPPNDLENEFYEKSISITDLNEDGFAEITFMYYMLCAEEVIPVPTKLMMLENGEKYAIRGDSYLNNYKIGGAKFGDMKGADQVLIDYANETWDKFCTPNPGGNEKAGLNFRQIRGMSWNGVEPAWELEFESSKLAYLVLDYGGRKIPLD